MAQDQFKRKLTTILSADVAGYSRLMGEDEAATVKTLEQFKGIMSELIRQHRGRVVDSPGDNLLAEFTSVVDAVQCAVATQKELQARNADLRENRRMQFRIGVNLGDVIEEASRIYGDGVNIAARLESLADPGGICVSKTAFDHIESKLPLGYEYLGEQQVKNITKPVGAYRVLMEPRVTVAGESKQPRARSFMPKRSILAGAAVVLLVAVGFGVWHQYFRQKTSPVEKASLEKMAFPLPDKPSIAVLPFVNLSEDSKQEYLSDGLTMDLIASLSKIRDLFVIARNSAFAYKGKPTNVKQIAEELGVQYVLEGSFRSAGERVRVTAQLIDALSGGHLWAERYDRSMGDFLALQDEITMSIVTALQVKLTEGEKIKVILRNTDNLNAYEKYLKGREHYLRFNLDDNVIARQLLQEAIALDPKFVSPYVDLAWTYMMDIHFGASGSPDESLAQADQLVRKAISLDETNPFAHGMLMDIFRAKGKYEDAIAQGEKTVTLSPNYSLSQAQLGRTLMYAGRFEEALSWLEKSIRLDPIPANWMLTSVGICYLHIGRLEDAVQEFKKVLNRNPNDILAAIRLVAAYSLLGRKEDASAAAAEVLRLNPKFSITRIAKSWQFKNDSDRDLEMNALREAGLPE
jgi:adenylate cyclase